ncbi:MAG: hypothetical protein ABI477_07385 [Chryseolinea sp.]
MSKRKKQIEEFFTSYESNFNKAISGEEGVNEAITSSFAECFIESSDAGILCGKNGAPFVDKIKQGFEFYKSIGASGMNIVSKDISFIDDLHGMVKVHWRYQYNKDGQQGAVDFNTFYLVNTMSAPKIFAYMAGDEQKVLKEKGLVPESIEVEH